MMSLFGNLGILGSSLTTGIISISLASAIALILTILMIKKSGARKTKTNISSGAETAIQVSHQTKNIDNFGGFIGRFLGLGKLHLTQWLQNVYLFIFFFITCNCILTPFIAAFMANGIFDSPVTVFFTQLIGSCVTFLFAQFVTRLIFELTFLSLRMFEDVHNLSEAIEDQLI